MDRRNVGLLALFLLVAVTSWAGVTVISTPKQPFEDMAGTIDFSDRLQAYVDNNTPQDNLATCTVVIVDLGGNNVLDNVAPDNSIVVRWDNSIIPGQTFPYSIRGGRDGKKYKLTVRCVSDNDVQVEQDVTFSVQER